ncbi:acetylesterase [Mediterraneibacter glycyrrhizinilyticus]|uniref:alpha/beta hydrolase n=1 Tax=Mediterraneibacter glycyrrhizinilyticus TaxID=342942 RepID=UPI0019614A9A|nr:alpha/beta hydrolase family protein [Mediterraneibacter glycyrrhizinilyticus]MBM6750415.1 acetylesterase [Mediterraneibacter glycyrrhizinilyticus]
MALIQVNYLSECLMRTVPVNVILPVDKLTFPGMPKREEKPYKTLYLLHGIFGNYTDWVSGTKIQRWAEEKDLAVVMPSGDNMFYVDQEDSHNFYGQFIGKELVDMTRKMFPLSRKREDTYIAGLSMGGYGALRNGLKYSETFGCIASLSGAMVVDHIAERTDDVPFFIDSRSFARSIFGDLDKAEESDKNPKWLVKKLKEEGKNIPRIYLTCGLQDSLLEANREMRDFLKEQGADVTYAEGKGAHEWDFWNRSIKDVLEWLPLEGSQAGMNSGNVGI